MTKIQKIEHFVLLILTIAVMVSVHRCRSEKQESQELSNDLKISKDSIRYFLETNCTLVAEKESYRMRIEDYKKSVLFNKQEQKELKKRIGKLSNLTNALKIELTAKEDLQLPVTDTVVFTKHDTIKGGSLHFHDRFLTLNGFCLNDSLYLKYRFRTGLDIATYWKSQGWFKPRSLVVNINPDNPHVTITGLNNYSITEPKKFYQDNRFWFGVGFVAAFIITRH